MAASSDASFVTLDSPTFSMIFRGTRFTANSSPLTLTLNTFENPPAPRRSPMLTPRMDSTWKRRSASGMDPRQGRARPWPVKGAISSLPSRKRRVLPARMQSTTKCVARSASCSGMSTIGHECHSGVSASSFSPTAARTRRHFTPWSVGQQPEDPMIRAATQRTREVR